MANARPLPRTFCELCVQPGSEWAPHAEVITRCFDQGLSALNRLLTEYSIATMDLTSRELSKESLPAVALVTFKDLRAPYYAHRFFRLHWLDGIEKRRLTFEERQVIEDRIHADRHPMLGTFHRQRALANRLPSQGDYAGTILATAIAIEALVAWLLTRYAEEDQSNLEKSVSTLMKGSIVRVVTTNLNWLGGPWSVDDSGSAAHAWKTHVADARNRIVHEGFRPSYRDAIRALDAGIDFSAALLDEVKSSGRQSWIDEMRVPADEVVTGRFAWEEQPPVP